MPKRSRELSAIEVSRLRAEGAHAAGGIPGLYLQIIGESRAWVLRYVIGARRRRMGLGSYPAVPLAQAREKACEARRLIDSGTDPIESRDQQKKATMTSRARALTFIQRAARFFHLQKLAFGAKLEGQTFGTATTSPARLNLLRMEEDLSAVHLRLHQITIERMDWATCIERYDRSHTLFYLDPPYWGTEGYDVAFGLEQYDRMAQLLRSMKGKAVVSVNDIPAMRTAFDGLRLRPLSITYTVGKAVQRAASSELLITNF